MKKLFLAVACAAALGAGGASQASVVNFDNPGVIEIDTNNVASYTESGFTLTGPAASFQLLDASLIGGIDGTMLLSLMTVGGGGFSLASIDYAFYDLGFGADPGNLSVIGLLNGVEVASQTFSLGNSSNASFGAEFGNLTGVTFSGTTAFALDNLNATAVAVPEPSTLALTAVGLFGMILRMNRKRKLVS